jgi:hypothetical protein
LIVPAIFPITNTPHEHEYDPNCLQPVLDHPAGRAHVEEEGMMKSALFADCGSGKIVKIVVSEPADSSTAYFPQYPSRLRRVSDGSNQVP